MLFRSLFRLCLVFSDIRAKKSVGKRNDFLSNPVSGPVITEEEHQKATKEQEKVLDFLREHRRVAISGSAGSGKTLLAMEKAARLDRSGLNVLMICHSPYLAEFLQDALLYTSVTVAPFCVWIRSFTYPETSSFSWSQYDEPTSAELENAFDHLQAGGQRYDAIIVDEAQDFTEEWWIVVEAALRSSESFLYLFYDSNQSLLPLRAKYPLERYPHHLEVNCRNAREIGSAVSQITARPMRILDDLAGGILRVTKFQKGEEISEISSALSRIMAEGLDRSLCVVTTEDGSPQDSLLADKVLELPPVGSWQDALRSAVAPLRPRRDRSPSSPQVRFPFPELSVAAYPTAEDIHEVCRWARAQVLHFPSASRRLRISWAQYRTSLVLSGPSLIPGSLLQFLSSEEWAASLPQPRRLRLTPHIAAFGLSDVPLHTPATIKGLEFDAVITFAAGPSPGLRAAVYVALSRARLHQEVLLSADAARILPRFS